MTHTDEWTAALFHYQPAMGLRERKGGQQEGLARARIRNIIQTAIFFTFPSARFREGPMVGLVIRADCGHTVSRGIERAKRLRIDS